MSWLLDTNVISEGVRKRPDRTVFDWVSSRSTDDIAISAVSVAELLDGVAAIADAERRKWFMRWIDSEIVTSIHGRILPVTTEILVIWLRLSRAFRARGLPRDPADLLLAATAHAHHLTLATRNTRHFANTGITVYNPWTDETHKMEAL
ncbi:MAG: type II toxin-antitoxin system VapC family toxin [Xanthobacteraceae bacterium]